MVDITTKTWWSQFELLEYAKPRKDFQSSNVFLKLLWYKVSRRVCVWRFFEVMKMGMIPTNVWEILFLISLDINDDCDNNNDGELDGDDDTQWYYSESYYS